MEKRYLLVSDTHGRNELLERIFRKEGLFYGLIFCGDGEGLEKEIWSIPGCPAELHMVKGNNDWGSELLYECVLKLGKYRIFLTHGHQYRVRTGLMSLSYRASEKMCDMCFFGHTHVPQMENMGGVLLVNPGSLTYPRQPDRKPSYVVITVDGDGELDFTFREAE